MAALPVPPPPSAQPDNDQPRVSGIIARMGQQGGANGNPAAEGQNLDKSGLQEIRAEIGRLGDSAMKLAKQAPIAAPFIMVHIAKLVEIGKAMQTDVDEQLNKQQGAGSPEAPPPSPTDAQPAA